MAEVIEHVADAPDIEAIGIDGTVLAQSLGILELDVVNVLTAEKAHPLQKIDAQKQHHKRYHARESNLHFLCHCHNRSLYFLNPLYMLFANAFWPAVELR